MIIPSITPEYIGKYIKEQNQLFNGDLNKLMAQVVGRDDIVPCVQRDTAYFLQFLVSLIQPYEILELGTGIGVSALIMATTLPTSRITTIERGEKFVQEALENFRRFKAENIEVIQGDLNRELLKLVGPYDFIFQDAGKQTYGNTLTHLVSLLRPGGLLMVDDTLFPAMELPERNRVSQRVIHEFNELVKSHPLLESYILPIGHGITVAKRLESPVTN